MTKKKHKSQNQLHQTKPQKGNINSLGFIKEALTLIGGLAGSILAVYGLVKTFKDDAEGFSWLIPVGIVIWLLILWRLFQVRKTTAYSLLIVSIIFGVVGWIGWQSQVKETEDKVVVLVAQFDGPEEKYGLRDQIMEELRQATKGYKDTYIIDGEEVVTSGQGSEYARGLGEKDKADLVIWAWYKPTENPNITIHFENLSTSQIETLQESESYQPQATLAELETFEVQRKIGSETKTLILFISGLLRFEANDYPTAIERFESILAADDISTFIDQKILYNNIGMSYYRSGDIEESIQSYSKAIDLDQKFDYAYDNRGNSYDDLGRSEEAINDYNKAIELNPNSPLQYLYYYDRGFAYARSGQYDKALGDFNKSIELEPKFVKAYGNRGNSYKALGQLESAMSDFNKVIELSPSEFMAYSNRGAIYYELGQYDNAIEDFNRAININPEFSPAYYNRGLVYQTIGNIIKSKADFKKYEELTGEKP
jgi:tetratricopeptide (TPR) repeat protein